MGGFGSGRHSNQSVVRRRDPRPEIKITELQKHDAFASGQPAQWSVTDSNGRLTEIAVFIFEDKAIIKAATTNSHRKPKMAEIDIALSWTDCNYGGRRPWFLCPGQLHQPCERRVANLYIYGTLLLCRHCCELGYESDYHTPQFRALYKAQKIIRELGGSGSLAEDFPPRPKGMHYDIYHGRYWLVMTYLEAFASGGSGPMLEERKEIGLVLGEPTSQAEEEKVA